MHKVNSGKKILTHDPFIGQQPEGGRCQQCQQPSRPCHQHHHLRRPRQMDWHQYPHRQVLGRPTASIQHHVSNNHIKPANQHEGISKTEYYCCAS